MDSDIYTIYINGENKQGANTPLLVIKTVITDLEDRYGGMFTVIDNRTNECVYQTQVADHDWMKEGF